MDPLTHAISGAALARAVPKRPLPWTQVLLITALAMHILLDVITSFGTMILAPVSDWRSRAWP